MKGIRYLYQIASVGMQTRRLYAGPRALGNAAVLDRDNTGLVLGDLEEHRFGKVEVALRRVAPDVDGLGVVGWAEVSGRNLDRAGQAPFWVVDAHDLEAGSTCVAVVEEGCAQCRGG